MVNLLVFVTIFSAVTVVRSEMETVIDGRRSHEYDQHNEAYPVFDVDEDYQTEHLRQMFADEGLHLSYDAAKGFNMFGALGQLFRSGDARRFSILNLAYQMSCYQGRGGNMIRQAVWALARYHGYGCYCGSSRYSGNFLDETDRCCKDHNRCYSEAQKKYNIGNSCRVFTTQYSVSCCKKQKYTKCTDSGPSVSRALCACDQAMAKCLSSKKAIRSYARTNLHNSKMCHATNSYVHGSTTAISSILKQCKAPATSIRKFPIKYGSQGKCPARKSHGWWISGKDQ